MANRVVFMDGGVIVEQNTAEAFFNDPQQLRTRIFADIQTKEPIIMKNLAKLTALTLTAALADGLRQQRRHHRARSGIRRREHRRGRVRRPVDRIRPRGTITVAMEGTWAPWTYHDENDNLVGYDVEVATKIAEKLGVEPKFVEGEWDGLLAGLDAGRYDIMVNGVDITPERAEKYDFSTPYAYNRTAVITKADDDSINTLEDLKGKDRQHDFQHLRRSWPSSTAQL